ncbi:MAG: AEC family transporter, partial [Bacillota bacterium]|nr:AEC family transporter [Bacillota bacterium]
NRGSSRKGLLKKVLVHPCMIAVYIGLFLMLTGIPLPGFMDKTVSALSSCTTAMTMVYIGTILSDVDWKTIVTGKQLYFSVMRLVIIPLIVWLPCRFLHVDPLITGVSVFLAAMPAGSTTSLLAAKYGADADSAAKCVVLSTALSVITVPVWGLLLGGI